MLEAATRILDKQGLAGLTTNRVAEVAGVSIGTVYQYFNDKSELLDALAEREVQALSDAVLAALTGPAPTEAGGRVRAVVRAVLQAYGGRTGVHRLLVEHLLATRGATPLPGMREAVVQMMSQDGIVGFDQRVRALAPADAFVLTHSVGGVVRALLAAPDRFDGAQREAIEDALVRLVVTVMDRDDTAAARDRRAAAVEMP
ncbi:TetR/AcrR family transcriptional regulator [Scleromatobacter humisilvae]|uniref:TetR/AcrR family transcriptional regulator n=1 Tax=Scleromatobacter humisilvae TaxID=2897159 RepID=A0A9X1YLV6_9BURK|nr:TetR/AcrR family transcriptional regulator [Scleromatobacter humisilvae]MCK9688709.1 TetR/AcrR family transcriptional regulator [Scleromatobacter humisilvae]